MSETPEAAPAEVTEAEAPVTEAPAPEASADDALGQAGMDALKSERNARKAAEKQLKDMQAQLQEIQDREKSDLEKATEAAKRFQDEAEASRQELARMKVAAEMGLPSDLVEFLTGSDVDSMMEQAKKLAKVNSPKTPAPDPGQGATPSGVAQLSRADLAGMTAAEIDQARLDGRLDNLLAGK